MTQTTTSILRPPYDTANMPFGIKRLPLSSKGYPVPWFVDRAAPLKDGDFDFRIMDHDRLKLAIRERRCWVCGLRMTTEEATFVAGPMCGINRNSAEPPCHAVCAEWAAQACPFLTMPKRVRDERGLPPEATVAGIAITRNPGVVMLWASRNYKPYKPPGGGILFDIGDPVPYGVEWFCQGRAATRAEVIGSINTGLPLLLKEANMEGPEACFELGCATANFMQYVPPGEPTT